MDSVTEFLGSRVAFKNGSGGGSGGGYGDGRGSGFGMTLIYDFASYDNGTGFGHGTGNFVEYGNCCGLKSVNGVDLHMVDGIPTGIYRARGNVAKGFVLQGFAAKPCYIAREGDLFAHGDTLIEAENALREKVFESVDEDEAIAKFVKHFKPQTLYKNSEFFEWHHYLTGSCRMGRENFCANNGVDLNGESTPEYFIALTEHSFGGGTIAKLKEYYSEVK